MVTLLKGVDYVFHLAAQAGVRNSWGDSFHSYLEHNVLVTQRLLEASQKCGIQRLIYASSSSVYGNTPDLPAREDSQLLPISPYGVTKLAAEHLCRLYNIEHNLPTISLRYFSVYGPRQRPDMAFHKFIRALILDEPISIFGDGEQSRDFTYVDDIVAANLAAMQHGRSGACYNLGGGVHTTIKEVINLLESITGKHARIHYHPHQAGDATHTLADTAAAYQELGFEPGFTLAEGLRNEVNWLSKMLAGSAPVGAMGNEGRDACVAPGASIQHWKS
jgi:UDP-glucose 4-epimerase